MSENRNRNLALMNLLKPRFPELVMSEDDYFFWNPDSRKDEWFIRCGIREYGPRSRSIRAIIYCQDRDKYQEWIDLVHKSHFDDFRNKMITLGREKDFSEMHPPSFDEKSRFAGNGVQWGVEFMYPKGLKNLPLPHEEKLLNRVLSELVQMVHETKEYRPS